MVSALSISVPILLCDNSVKRLTKINGIILEATKSFEDKIISPPFFFN